jgi:RNA polymerase sigma-70 factor (ECF subfamily)
MREGPSDIEVIARSWSEPEAFGLVYERHAHELLRYFARRTFDPEAAADLLAETFAQAFASRRRFRDQGLGVTGWLYGIARHQLSRLARQGAVDSRARRRLGMPEREISVEDYDRIEELIDFASVGRTIERAFGTLSDEHREALTLRVVQARPYREVAEMLGCSQETARARVSRGLKRLASEIDQPEFGTARKETT